jgi:hypothetical protein
MPVSNYGKIPDIGTVEDLHGDLQRLSEYLFQPHVWKSQAHASLKAEAYQKSSDSFRMMTPHEVGCGRAQ